MQIKMDTVTNKSFSGQFVKKLCRKEQKEAKTVVRVGGKRRGKTNKSKVLLTPFHIQ